jgi:hypothetical protein
MRHPQILVYGDSQLAAELRPLAKRRRWVLREPPFTVSCLRQLQPGAPAVLVLRVKCGVPQDEPDDPEARGRWERELLRRFRLLERVAWLFPETRVLVLGDTAHAPLEDLAWDLGASLCLFPPGPEDRLPETVAALMGFPEEPDDSEEDSDDA